MAGYSKRTLVEKLGIKSGTRVVFLHQPDGYERTLGVLPPDVQASLALQPMSDFIQLFTTSRRSLTQDFPALTKAVAVAGQVWIPWPKGAAKLNTDLNENIVREIGLAAGMLDVKVCAVAETWSGLKFVFRLKDRKGK